MILRQRVRSLIAVRRDAFGPGDVDEGVVSGLMRRFRYVMNRLQLFFWLEKAFIASRNIVVDLNAEDTARLGLVDNLLRIAAPESVRADAHVVSPVLLGRDWSGRQAQREQSYKDPYEKRIPSFH